MPTYVQEMRSLIGTRLMFMPGVRAIITKPDGDVLLQRRTDMAFWGLPAGGMELNESALETLKREVREETSLEVLHAEPMALYSGREQQVEYPNGDRIQCFSLTFIVREWSGVPRPDGEEGSELRFFPLSQLPENLMPVHRKTLQDFSRYSGTFLVE